MTFKLVDRPQFRPNHCAAIPHRGQTAEGERWVDTQAEMPGFDNHVYLSETAVAEAARVLGFPTPAEHAKLAAELAQALQDNLTLIDRLKALSHLEGAMDAMQELMTA
jgi:hypothetical protein